MKNVTPELIAKARTAKTVEELLELAKANNVELTEEEAKTYFAQLNANGAVSDEELDVVSGGNEDEKSCVFDDWTGNDPKSDDRTTSPLYTEECPSCKARLTPTEMKKDTCPVCRQPFSKRGYIM